MKVKVLCSCQARYEFEIEPVQGRMPYAIKCPVCAADGTELANAIIARQLQAVGTPPPAPASSQVPTPIVRVASRSSKPEGPPLEAPPTAPANESGDACSKHPKEIAVEHCRVCGKPICPICMDRFGYVCSVYCRRQAGQQKIDLPVYENLATDVQQKEDKKATRLVLGVLGGLGFIFAIWAWYAFSGSKPKVIYSQKISAGPSEQFQLAGSSEMFQINTSEIALFNFARKKKVWSTPLPPEISKAPTPTKSDFRRTLKEFKKRQGDDITERMEPENDEDDFGLWEDFYPRRRQLLVTENTVWMIGSGYLVEFDRKTGAEKSKTKVPDPIIQTIRNSTGLLLVSAPKGARVFTLLDAASGQIRKEEIKIAQISTTVAKATAATTAPPGEEEADFKLPGAESGQFFPAGANIARMGIELVEERRVAYEAMRNPGKPALTEKLTAGQSMSATRDLMNEMKRNRTGGLKYQDESNYRVTIERLPGAGTPPWKGEVIGLPHLHPLKSIDLLLAGKQVVALDKKNQKLWSANLTYPVSTRIGSGSFEEGPAREEKGTIYIYDQGMLTAFEQWNGVARWRLSSVGITSLHFDGQGNIYLSTTTASPDDLKYSEDLTFEKAFPQLLKIEAQSGKMLWKAERVGEQCYLSGDFIYTTRSQISTMDMIGRQYSDDPDLKVNFRIFRINPKTGDEMWEFYQRKRPMKIEVHKNCLLLQFHDEIKVLKFLAL